VATGYDGSNEYQIVLTGGGCSALSDDSVLFGSSLNSNFGGPQGFPKVALVAYLTVDKAVYGSTNTSFAADGLFCAPNTTLCLVLYDDPTGQPDWFEVVDTSNITQKLQPVSLGFAATSSPVFANGNVYLAPSGQE
jgi:hypothetical protein